MQLYRFSSGNILKKDEQYYLIEDDWDLLINREHLYAHLLEKSRTALELAPENFVQSFIHGILPPIGKQEVWAAGVTYLRSRDARIEEAKENGLGDCYAKVYDAERPELFFKSTHWRVSGHAQQVAFRRDSTWNIPEPELALFISSHGTIQGYTAGNDMSSRSIEGENPLYLPQAKVYNKSTALGPCLYIPEHPISRDTKIELNIKRSGEDVFNGSVTLDRMKRSLEELAAYLFHSTDFPDGVFLMTGTGIVPGDDFTLVVNDEVNVTIDGIGTLSNIVISTA
jgi:2-dehydro-3-deoxy-D-arabinonate dehydratase